MTGLTKISFGSLCLATVGFVAATGLVIPPARAGFAVPPTYAVSYEGDPHNLDFANSNVVGNIGIGNSGGFVGSGFGTITGSVEFAAPNNGQYMPDGITVSGGATFGNANVQTDLNGLNSLSQSLGGEAGARLSLSAGGSVNASSGILDSNGNEVFTATIGRSFVAGTTFTITGTSGQSVVINIPSTGGLPFNGSIVLAGGITSDQVLFNFDSGDYDTQTGGDPLTIENGLPTIDPATTGTYLDPNGAIDIVDSVINGRVLGGDSVDMGITDSTINAPASIPEPTSLALLGAGLAALGIIRRRRSRVLARS
jgi:hypothetical protein